MSHNAPEFTICLDAASSHSDLDYDFTSIDLIAGGNLDWINYDGATNKFIISPSKQEYEDYHGQTITVKFEVYDKTPSSTRPRLTANDFEFEIELNSIVLEKCYASTLQAQSSTPPQTVSFFEDPQPFTVSLVTDSGTAALQ